MRAEHARRRLVSAREAALDDLLLAVALLTLFGRRVRARRQVLERGQDALEFDAGVGLFAEVREQPLADDGRASRRRCPARSGSVSS